jgi:hypothetical protein
LSAWDWVLVDGLWWIGRNGIVEGYLLFELVLY